MVSLKPIERLNWLESELALKDHRPHLKTVIDMYDVFLQSKRDDKFLLSEFSDPEKAHKYIDSGNKFCEVMFKAISEIGERSRLHQIMLI